MGSEDEMLLLNHQKSDQRETDATSTDGLSPAEAYISWLNAGRWQIDPIQPCLLYKVYRNVERIALDARFPLRLGSSRDLLFNAVSVSLEATPEQRLAWMLYYTHGLTRFTRPAPAS